MPHFKKILLIAALAASPALCSEKTVVVKDDHDVGVKSEVFLKKNEKEAPQGPTDDNGQLTLVAGCSQGEVIRAKPESELFYEGKRYCDPQQEVIEVLVTSIGFYENLRSNGEQLETNEEWSKAALVYNEMSVRARAWDREEAESWRQKAYELFAKHIELPSDVEIVVPYKGRKVVSPGYQDAIRRYQAQEGIPETGRIDYGTLASAAGQDVGVYLFHRQEKFQGP